MYSNTQDEDNERPTVLEQEAWFLKQKNERPKKSLLLGKEETESTKS